MNEFSVPELAFLPERYREDWFDEWNEIVDPVLTEGCRILDFGGGAQPIVPIDRRPAGCHYVGIDVSRDEMERAPAGSFDEMIVGDIAKELDATELEFDLVVSWQVLEHVSDLPGTVAAIHRTLAPGGTFAAQLSGRNAMFSVFNRLIPERAGEYAMWKLLGREPDSVFKAHYDKCTASGLREALGDWSEVEVTPRYRGVAYLLFSPLLARGFVKYEDWTIASGREDLATHYVVRAVR